MDSNEESTAQGLTREEIDLALKKEMEHQKAQRKATLTWNIIFFLGIVATSITVSVITNPGTLNLKEIFLPDRVEKFSLATSLIGITISFLIGVLSSVWRSRASRNKQSMAIKEFVKESYLGRLDKSSLNPERNV